jgi:hypothetical protein
MGGTIQLPVKDRDLAHVAACAARVRNLWAGVTVTIADRTVALASTLHANASLELIWTCALLNERLVAANAERRSRVLADLVA